jgi:hypothetical protein
MATNTNTNSLADVLALAQSCEEVARATLGVGQRMLRAKDITQETFDQVFQDYTLAMQKARDMYYEASHGLVQQLLQSAELKALTGETAELNRSLARLQKTEQVLTISFSMVTLVAALATAVMTPGSETLRGAYEAAKTVKDAITG